MTHQTPQPTPAGPLSVSPTWTNGQDPGALAAALVASAADAIIGMDRNGLVTVWNAGSESLFGWTSEQMLGATVEALIPPERRAELARVLRALAGTSELAAIETERIHRSGARLPVSCRLSAIRDATGAVVGACALVRDISLEVELRRQRDAARQAAEARFEQSVIAQATLTPDGRILEVNDPLCGLSGYTRQDLLGQSVTEFMSTPDVATAERELSALATGDMAALRRPQLLRHAEGRVIETRISLFPVRDQEGTIERLEAVIEDVSEAAAAHRELELREARWRSLASHSSDVALLCTSDAQLLFASDSALTVFGYRAQDLVDVDGWQFVHPDDVAGVKATWAAVAAAPMGTSVAFEVRLLHADGTWRWVEETLTNQVDDPAVQAMVVNLADISERKSAEAVLQELAGVDTLTGLATRAPLMAALDTAFAAGLAATTAVLLVDVTQLMLINDTYGPHVGDDVLVEVGARLSRVAHERGITARTDGGQFGVLVRDVDDISEVFELGAALLDAVQQPLHVAEPPIVLAATIGAAVGPAVDAGALLASAGAALLTAKEGLAGPLHIVRVESASTEVSRARLIEDLRRGLARDELVVHYQPVISLSDGRPVAAEALVRWQHPDKGLLSPGAFIGAAEDSGLIIELGRFVLHEACRAAARWAHIGGSRSTFHIAVNLSAKQLTRGTIIDDVRRALQGSGASPANLMLEVTESAVMTDMDEAVRTLQQIRALGVAIAVDDFGTGYSSLTYLKKFPVTALKIDRSFVNGLGKHSDDAAIVTSVINLARSMDLDCIAEGIETEQQRLILQALGCTLGQGFLWAPGLDAAAFQAWLGSAAQRGQAQRKELSAALPTNDPTMQPTRRLSIDPTVLNRVLDLSAIGASLTTIAAALNADQQLTPSGKRWTSRTVAQLLAQRSLA